ncbi:hypothetical protein ACFXAF_00675 [Kitasatospora sp. NPDC059463]|uniref:hypothetical protein n=1 Tax=unclassified Kitasatospora TaxID=2633591 RepID=UPI0036BC9BCE
MADVRFARGLEGGRTDTSRVIEEWEERTGGGEGGRTASGPLTTLTGFTTRPNASAARCRTQATALPVLAGHRLPIAGLAALLHFAALTSPPVREDGGHAVRLAHLDLFTTCNDPELDVLFGDLRLVHCAAGRAPKESLFAVVAPDSRTLLSAHGVRWVRSPLPASRGRREECP